MSENFDAFGLDEKLVDDTLDFLDWYYQFWHRVELTGGDNIPNRGSIIVFGNHAGFNMLDALMTMVGIRLHTPSKRLLRGMHHIGIEKIPLINEFVFNKLGGVIGHPSNAAYILQKEGAILTYPEGGHSSSKEFRDRRDLVPMKQFGSGFIKLAIRHKVPLIPVATIGCEEAMPTWYVSKWLGRVFKFDDGEYPLVPQSLFTLFPSMLGMPLHSFHFLFGFPSKIKIKIGEPIFLDSEEDIDDIKRKLYFRLKEMIRLLVNE